MLVLPALLAILPQPALSAAAALERDVMLSICGQDGPQQDGEGGHRSATHEHCVLCSASCSGVGPGLATATPAFAAQPQRPLLPQKEAAGRLAAPLAALLDASPLRGPPTRR